MNSQERDTFTGRVMTVIGCLNDGDFSRERLMQKTFMVGGFAQSLLLSASDSLELYRAAGDARALLLSFYRAHNHVDPEGAADEDVGNMLDAALEFGDFDSLDFDPAFDGVAAAGERP